MCVCVCVCVCVVHPESAMQNVADNKTSQSAMYQNTQVALVMFVGPYFFRFFDCCLSTIPNIQIKCMCGCVWVCVGVCVCVTHLPYRLKCVCVTQLPCRLKCVRVCMFECE